jgi:hypothetical protein
MIHSHLNRNSINSNIKIATYNDQCNGLRPIEKVVQIIVADANVVSKSYPDFGRI